MPLPIPDLDDRRFQDLVDEAKRLVMRRCPEWTDHNVSDPGVTLIETFAYMTDQLLYRMNQIPDRLHLTFLDLLGLRMLPPTPARVGVTFWLSAPATMALTIPAGTQVGTLAYPDRRASHLRDGRRSRHRALLAASIRTPADRADDDGRGADDGDGAGGAADGATRDRTAVLASGRPFPAFSRHPAAR